jgi:scyllo-inositol 2-dehydrogenase (NADP+)
MKKIVTALASYGMWGEVFHAPLINYCEGLDLKYIVQRTKNTALEKYPLVTILKNFEEILEIPEIELVVMNNLGKFRN